MTWRGQVVGACLALASSGAQAAGGAHVIDDAGVETPGTCHFETWVTGFGAGRGLANVSPACTREAWPSLELGGGAQYVRDHPDDALLGPAAKLNLVPNGGAFGLALSAGGAWSLRRDRLETAGVVAPLSWTLNTRTQLNLNAGWMYARAARHRHDATFGAQANFLAVENLSLMAEAVGHAHLRAGGQVGVRWNPGGGDLDFDLLAGRYPDGVSRNAVTLGVTLRR